VTYYFAAEVLEFLLGFVAFAAGCRRGRRRSGLTDTSGRHGSKRRWLRTSNDRPLERVVFADEVHISDASFFSLTLPTRRVTEFTFSLVPLTDSVAADTLVSHIATLCYRHRRHHPCLSATGTLESVACADVVCRSDSTATTARRRPPPQSIRPVRQAQWSTRGVEWGSYWRHPDSDDDCDVTGHSSVCAASVDLLTYWPTQSLNIHSSPRDRQTTDSIPPISYTQWTSSHWWKLIASGVMLWRFYLFILFIYLFKNSLFVDKYARQFRALFVVSCTINRAQYNDRRFLADRTNGRAYATVLCPSVCCL